MEKGISRAKRDDSPWTSDFDGNIFLRGKVERITFGLLSKKNGDYLHSLEIIKRANLCRSCDDQIEVCKCRMKNGSYQLTYDKQFSYLNELDRLR